MADETATGQEDWVANAANSIIDVVDKAKTMGTDNAVRALRGIVFGLIALVFAIAAIVFSVIIMIRLADAYLPIGAGVGDATWAAHLFIGGLLTIIGFGLWGSRKTETMSRFWLAVVIDAIIIAGIIGYAVVDRFA